MEKVRYTLVYKANDRVNSTEIDINLDESIDSDKVYEQCYDFLEDINVIGGRPISVTTTAKRFPNFCFTTSNEVCSECSKLQASTEENDENGFKSKEEGSRVWCLVEVPDKSKIISTTWIPGMLHEDGSITSVLGKLSSPDSSEDLRPFHDCPFPEYFILSKRKYTPQVDEFLSSLKPCIVKAVITPTFGKPFSIIKEILVLPELSDKDQEIYLRRKIKENLAGSIYSIELYNYRIVPKFDTFKYPVHDYSNKFENINLESDYVIVRFEVIGEVGVVSYALPLPTLKRNTSVPLNFYLRRNIEVLYPGKDIEILEVIQDSGCIADLPVILEKDYLPSK